MASIYQKAIGDLSIHLHNPRAQDSVMRAIKKLEAQEAEDRVEEYLKKDVAPVILQKLIQKNALTALTESQKMQMISHEFLCTQRLGEHKLEYIQDDTYSLTGSDNIVYKFVLTVLPQLNGVLLQRSPEGGRKLVTGAFAFEEIPSLAACDREKDESILKDCLVELRSHLKWCWEELDAEDTSNEQDLLDEIGESNSVDSE